MSVNTSDVSKAQEKVLGSPQEPISIYEEPVSGVQGAGTADQPYDQGNQPEQAAGPGIEPPSGQTGKGTATEPYDQGNQPENKPSIIDELSRTKSPKDKTSKVSQANGASTISSAATITSNGTTAPAPAPAPAPVERKEERKMSIIDQLSRTRTKDEREADKHKDKTEEAPRGRDRAQSITASSNPNKERLAPRPRPVTERSMSPGQLDDGTHVKCSGERGEAYTPPGTIDKIKGKLHFGGKS
ncbi:hypothetical protein H2198_009083 [Neophaeococcomyces mojaviensis]|uniref:Uncharacterized protein n=1 Tax=Neophaeococcomyces mojaviensis TaxID=3383035 RepID=A0ACC2ZVL6_9EURO|nr:hypothetical protein H2198_009083 [Knufia sp. JES_112]